MNFFGLGGMELAAIAVLALIVVGPKQLPALLKQLGGWVSKAQSLQRDLRRGIDDIVRDADLEDVSKTVQNARSFTPAGAASNFLNRELKAADGFTATKANPSAEPDVRKPTAASPPPPPPSTTKNGPSPRGSADDGS